MTVSKKEQTERLRQNEEKWSKPLMDAGWTVLPTVILKRQQALGLDALDINILLHLASHWWYADRPPYPSKGAIAECIGVDPSTVRRRIAKLERDGLIRREARYSADDGKQMSNIYHFEGLIEGAKPFAREEMQAKKQQRSEAARRRTRKRPKLRLVQDQEADK